MTKKRARKPKPFDAYIKSALRRVWRWHPERRLALKRASIGYKYGVEYFRCEKCGAQPLKRKDKQVDHVVEVESLGIWDGDWTSYINRMNCTADGLQILCIPCHKAKTQSNNKTRRSARKTTKKKRKRGTCYVV